ncbi:glycosyltransferase family 2 protein [Acuticoccus sp.]|uniref:glycosyltransferase family 2 protein n=1 Tax=Acuticoccus sp. TaxID=1904378 RepID=UPI003B51689D
MRVAVETSVGTVPLRASDDGTVIFAADEQLGEVRLWPVEDGWTNVDPRLSPIAPWNTLMPDWRLGPVRQPPRLATASRTRPATPAGWAAPIAEAEAVDVDGARLEVGEAGVLALAFEPALAPGWHRVEATILDAGGHHALVDPSLLSPAATSPRDRLAVLRPRSGVYAAALRITVPTTRLLFRPREQRGTVVVPRLEVRRLGPLAEPRDRLLRAAVAVAGWRRPVRPAPLVRTRPLARGPSVTVITATRDAPRHLARYLATLSQTAYAPFDVILVDNGTRDPEALALLEEAAQTMRVRRDPRPFNFAALCNAAAREAQGDVLVFANNDVAFVEPGWLAPLATAAVDPATGAAGARLLYPNGRVQHAGLVLAGEARVRHAERFLPARAAGHRDRQRLPSEVVAVTGALMAMRREVFLALGGFDAVRYAVLLNDVDLCLRARRAGLVNRLIPESVAVHDESVTIGQRRSADLLARGGAVWQHERAAEADHLRRAWADVLDADPCYPREHDSVAARFRPHRKTVP